ncbi:MAG: endonuclease/exonuclease/phosphatase family protein [Balneolaceae bacterium]|nr:endonuclease/exonuclease/phosphatase family protein [Balneolaceae bacterium]
MIKKMLFLTLVFLGFNASVFAQNTPSDEIRIVTWNIEHLAENDGEGCVARTEADYAKLRTFAATMSADVVALQEVESAKAVARVFPLSDWNIVMSERPDTEAYECRGSGRPSTQQKVAYAIRKGVNFENLGSFEELALNRRGLRHGLVIKLLDGPSPIEVMNVHMKSGCFVNDYSTSDRDACETYEQQAPILDEWIEERIESNTGFVVLGDFNHRIVEPENRLWSDLTTMDGAPVQLRNSMANLRGCHPRYPAPIDHVVVGSAALNFYEEGSEQVFFFTDENMTEEDMLSDHCPVGLDLNFNLSESHPPSTAVRWTQNSAEYRLITASLYKMAMGNLEANIPENEPWVVFMDVDETILDNSAYNYSRDVAGLSFTPESWNEWVMREEAGIVPGSKEFVEFVLSNGGQIALITNRDREMDAHTWSNLEKLGYPITRANTCIMGRAAEDKEAVGRPGIVNDKDLRRNQIMTGEASYCWESHPEAKAAWNQPLAVIMQVGDNIKDFIFTTQENVNLEEFLQLQGIDILILPNAMYGSWD